MLAYCDIRKYLFVRYYFKTTLKFVIIACFLVFSQENYMVIIIIIITIIIITIIVYTPDLG